MVVFIEMYQSIIFCTKGYIDRGWSTRDDFSWWEKSFQDISITISFFLIRIKIFSFFFWWIAWYAYQCYHCVWSRLYGYMYDPFEHQNMRFWRSVSSGSFPRICSEIVLKSRAVRSIHFFVFKSSERKKDHASSSDWLGSVRVPSLSKRKTFLWISNASRMNSWKERSIDSIFLLIVKKREFESNKILFSVYFFLTFCLFSHFPYTHFMNNILLKNHEIGHYSGYKTSVFSDYFFELTTESDLPKLANIYRFSLENNIPFLIIWWWTNILFSSEKFRGIIVKNSLSGWEYNQDKKFLHAFSNEPIWAIAQTLENDFSQDIWHRFIWLPGSIGGAIYGNAGCFGLEIESNFLRATVFDMFLEKRRNISREEIFISKRKSTTLSFMSLFWSFWKTRKISFWCG